MLTGHQPHGEQGELRGLATSAGVGSEESERERERCTLWDTPERVAAFALRNLTEEKGAE